jgi:hypothetical protein
LAFILTRQTAIAIPSYGLILGIPSDGTCEEYPPEPESQPSDQCDYRNYRDDDKDLMKEWSHRHFS